MRVRGLIVSGANGERFLGRVVAPANLGDALRGLSLLVSIAALGATLALQYAADRSGDATTVARWEAVTDALASMARRDEQFDDRLRRLETRQAGLVARTDDLHGRLSAVDAELQRIRRYYGDSP